MEAGIQFGRISRLLTYSAQRKALQAAPQFLWRARTLWDPHDLHQAAVDALRPSFPSASAQEVDVVAFYLLGSIAVALSDVLPPGGSLDDLADVAEDVNGKLESMNELSELTSLRLQMMMDRPMMDRRSKFISTLSNIMTKISSTQDTLVRNLK